MEQSSFSTHPLEVRIMLAAIFIAFMAFVLYYSYSLLAPSFDTTNNPAAVKYATKLILFLCFVCYSSDVIRKKVLNK